MSEGGNATFTGTLTVGTTAGSSIHMLRTSANYINATNSTGYLVFRTGGYDTALTLDASQNATFAGTIGSGAITSTGAIKQSSRITLNTNGTITWGSANAHGLLSWDTGYSLINGLSGNGIKFGTNGSTLALTLDTSQNATFAGMIISPSTVYVGTSLAHYGDGDTNVTFDTNDLKLKAGGATHFHAASDQTTTLYSGNSIALTLDTSQNATFAGNVALGGGALQSYHTNVTSALALDDQISVFTRANQMFLGNNFYYGASDGGIAIEADKSSLIQIDRDKVRFFFAASVSAGASASLTEKFRLDDTGKLTIPGEIEGGSLDINGNADISGNLTGVDTLTATTLSVTNYGLASGDIPNNAADTTGDAGSVDGRHYQQHYGVGYKYDITIGGDSDKYYPVVIDGTWAYSQTIDIHRAYNETGPNDWNTATHKGGLTFQYQIIGSNGWGGYPTGIKVTQAGEAYAHLLGGISHTAHGMKHVVWLRGGTALYHVYCHSALTLEINDSTSASNYVAGSSPNAWYSYDNSNNSYDTTVAERTAAQAISVMEAEIFNNMDVSYRQGQTTEGLIAVGAAKTFPTLQSNQTFTGVNTFHPGSNLNIAIEAVSSDAGCYIRYKDGADSNRWYQGVNNGSFVTYNNSNVSVLTLSGTQCTIAGELEAASLDINGNADISGALTLGTVLAAAEGGTGLSSISTLLNSNVTTTTLGAVKGTHKVWSSVVSDPGTDAWYKIFRCTDGSSTPVECHLKGYAHTSLSFIVSEGYQGGAAHINILDAHVSSANSGYKYIKGVRINSLGDVEVLLNSGSNVNVEITVIGDAEVPSTLAVTSVSNPTIKDSVTTLSNGMIRAYGQITGTELEGTSLDINGNADISGTLTTGNVYVGTATTNGGVINLIQSASNPEIRIQSGESGATAFSIYNTATNPDTEQFFINNTLSVSHLGNKRGALKLEDSSGTALTLSSGNATFAGTIGSGAITSTGKIQGTELEGTSLDINGNADISGTLDVGAINSDAVVTINPGSNAVSTLKLRRDTSGDSTIVGDIEFDTSAAQGTDDRIALIRAQTSAGDSSNRGGEMRLYTRQSGSGSFNTTTYSKDGQWTFPGEIEATSLDINGNADISGTTRFGNTVTIVGTNSTNAESVLLRGISSNDGDFLGSIRTANTGGYNQEMRFYTSNANGTTDEDLTLTLKPDQSATFAGDITASSHGHSFGSSIFKAPDATASIAQQIMCADGSNAATFRTTTSGRVFEIRSQNSGTIKIDSSSTTFTGDVNLADSKKLQLGASQDLQIYHNGTDSYIDDAGAGDLRIRSNFLKIEKYTGETMATFNDDNAVSLYYNNAVKIATVTGGVNVTGTLTATADVIAYSDRKIKRKCTNIRR